MIADGQTRRMFSSLVSSSSERLFSYWDDDGYTRNGRSMATRSRLHVSIDVGEIFVLEECLSSSRRRFLRIFHMEI